MLAVGENFVLFRQKRATTIDKVDAGQSVLGSHFLCAQMLLDRQREVTTTLDRRVVGDNHYLAPMDDADAGNDAGRPHVIIVDSIRRQWREFEKRRAAVEKHVNPLAGSELAARAVALDCLR